MRLTILGSGTNVHPARAAAGYLVETDQTLVVDFGPRTLLNLVRTGIDRHSLRYLLFSHFHVDHFADFLPFFFDAVFHAKHVGSRPDLQLIGPRGTVALFEGLLKTIPGFESARFRVRLREVGERPFRLGETLIVPVTVVHSPRLHCLGYRLEYAGRTLGYSGDTTYCPALLDLCRGVDVALLDCSFAADRPGPGHLHAGECGRAAREAGAACLVLTHFYEEAERSDLKAQAAEEFRGRIRMGRDLLTLSV